MTAFNSDSPRAVHVPEDWAWHLRHTVHPPPPAPQSPPDAQREPPGGPFFAVRVLDNPVNTYQQVMEVCSAALGISFDEAFSIAQTIDTAGSCVVCVAPKPDAERVAAQIASIGI